MSGKPLTAARSGARRTALALAVLLSAASLHGQASFGFEDDGTAGGGTDDAGRTAVAAPSGVAIGGKLDYRPVLFFAADEHPFADQTVARVDIESRGSSVDLSVKLKVSGKTLAETPRDILDEASVRTFLGPLSVEGGWLKVFWGKADSQGPLDVINPFDLTDLTVTETRDRKIARPMLRASLALGAMTTAEAVAIPGFAPNRISWDGPWEPRAVAERKEGLEAFAAAYGSTIDTSEEASIISYPDTDKSDYLQGGVRLATTIGRADFGLQAFSGYLPTPAVSADEAALAALIGSQTPLEAEYNRYTQFGADSAAVVAGFNFRAELAANLTKDLNGDDPEIYNSALAWSFGLDRDLFSGVNVNLQGTGSCRLGDSEVGDDPYDIEAGTDATHTTVTAIVSQKLYGARLKWEVKGLFGIENPDFMVVPKVSFEIGDAVLEAAAGFFGGDENGDYGQFEDSSYLRIGLSYEY